MSAASLSQLVISLIGGAASAVAIVAVLGKRLVDHQFGKALERFKAELTERGDALKVGLSIYAHEQSVSLSRVDVQRANAIQAIFAAMRVYRDTLKDLVEGTTEPQPQPSDIWHHVRDSTRAAYIAGRAFAKTLEDNAIYVDRSTYESLRDASDLSLGAVGTLAEQVAEIEREHLGEDVVDQIEDERELIAGIIRKDVEPAFSQMVSHLRHVLGTER